MAKNEPVQIELPKVRCLGWAEFWKAVGEAVNPQPPKPRPSPAAGRKGAKRGK